MALNANQKRYVKNKLSGMSRSGAYMDAYDTEDEDYARKAAHRLMTTNDDVRKTIREGLDAAIQEAQEILEADSIESVETLIDLRKAGDKEDGIRFRAAESILDRAGLKATEKAEVTGTLEIKVDLPEGITLGDL